MTMIYPVGWIGVHQTLPSPTNCSSLSEFADPCGRETCASAADDLAIRHKGELLREPINRRGREGGLSRRLPDECHEMTETCPDP
jgi:hypothetical protein